jgi:hypothetical protein
MSIHRRILVVAASLLVGVGAEAALSQDELQPVGGTRYLVRANGDGTVNCNGGCNPSGLCYCCSC